MSECDSQFSFECHMYCESHCESHCEFQWIWSEVSCQRSNTVFTKRENSRWLIAGPYFFQPCHLYYSYTKYENKPVQSYLSTEIVFTSLVSGALIIGGHLKLLWKTLSMQRTHSQAQTHKKPIIIHNINDDDM